MRLSTAILALLPVASLACNHENMKRQAENSTSEFPKFTPGNDGPADVATLGYFVNHVCLMVSNLTASREWYSDVLGMRHMFTFDISESFSIMYMAHSQGGRNGTGFQTGEELNRHKNNLAGLVEFVQYKVRSGPALPPPPASPSSTHPAAAYYIDRALGGHGLTRQQPNANTKKFTPTPANTFSHLGLIVPDLLVAQERFDKMGVEIVKRVGELDFSAETGNDMVANAWGLNDLKDPETQATLKAIYPGLRVLGFDTLLVIADPDGNLFELQAFIPESI